MSATPLRVLEVDWDDAQAVALRAGMDLEMAARYDADPDDPHPALRLDPAQIVATCLALGPGGDAVGHAALRRLPSRPADQLEVKRVIVTPAARRRGAGMALMGWLDDRGRALGARRLVLHTGRRQPEAIALYEGLGWEPVPVFPPYTELPLSLCYAKDL